MKKLFIGILALLTCFFTNASMAATSQPHLECIDDNLPQEFGYAEYWYQLERIPGGKYKLYHYLDDGTLNDVEIMEKVEDEDKISSNSINEWKRPLSGRLIIEKDRSGEISYELFTWVNGNMETYFYCKPINSSELKR